MRGTTRTVAVAGISALALLTAACGGSDSSGSTATGSGGGTGGEYVAYGCNPQNPLVPGNTGENCGGRIVRLFEATLFHYDPKTAEPKNDIAESIETKDNKHFTVKIKQGYKFSDGTEVKAHNFVDAWNYTAYGPNGQYLSYFFEPIAGFTDLQAAEGKTPKAKKMSGLKVVDDYTFTIDTSEPVSNLPVRLGYDAFAPEPDAFFKDPKNFGEKPIGAGPYKVDSWDKGQQIVLTKNENYSGDFAGTAEKITFRIFQDTDSAYNDLLGGQLDVLDQVPTSALIDDKYKQDLPDRNTSQPYGAVQTITFAPDKVDPRYANGKLRQAISMAIDRDTIVKQIFNGARNPADGWVAPGVQGYAAGACGDYCTYDPQKAKELLKEAGGFDGKMTIAYNADGDHKAWTEATCNSIQKALDVPCVATPVVDFATFRDKIGNGKLKGMFRSGWVMDYPHIENFLAPLYKTNAASNDNDYSNPAFDKKLNEAAAASTPEESNKLYQEAERMLANDMPAIPMWYYAAQAGWSDHVDNVTVTAFGEPDYRSITVK